MSAGRRARRVHPLSPVLMSLYCCLPPRHPTPVSTFYIVDIAPLVELLLYQIELVPYLNRNHLYRGYAIMEIASYFVISLGCKSNRYFFILRRLAATELCRSIIACDPNDYLLKATFRPVWIGYGAHFTTRYTSYARVRMFVMYVGRTLRYQLVC